MTSRQEQAVTRLISSYFKGTLKHHGLTLDCGCAIVHIEGGYVTSYPQIYGYPDLSSGYSEPELRQVERAFEFLDGYKGYLKCRKDKDSFIGLTAVFNILSELDPEDVTIDLNNLSYEIV